MVKLIATCFYIGYLPLMPGTWASLAGVGVYYVFRNQPFYFAILTFFLLLLGILISTKAEKEIGKKDPREIVIDEFSSQMLVFAFMPFNVITVILGFILFRVLDIFKLPPIKKLQHLPGGWGIMLDDVASAIAVNLILRLSVNLYM